MDYFYIYLFVGLYALVLASFFYFKNKKLKSGTKKMIEYSSYISEGAKAFLIRQNKILVSIIIIFFVIILYLINIETAYSFLFGTLVSILAGYLGMHAATSVNGKVANVAKEEGIDETFKVAISGGAVMGLSVGALGLLGITIIYFLTRDTNILTGFGLGASLTALFARVGGGIYTKTADIGADLVGKGELNIPEDDPRNPAVIADNVGDNVGDIAGMGSDLFQSFVCALIGAMTIGLTKYGTRGIYFPLFVSIIGILASILGIKIMINIKSMKPHKRIRFGLFIATFVLVVTTYFMSDILFATIEPFYAIAIGGIIGVLIGSTTEYYTSEHYKPVLGIASKSETGSAINIISGIATGMYSTLIPIILITAGILIAYSVNGIYGVALTALGMLATVTVTVTIDAYGPIVDNAGGIANMARLPKRVRKITDELDSIGNNTAAIGKGFAIGAAALTSLALFASYATVSGVSDINILEPIVIIGILVGGALPFLFSALTINAVGKSAFKMVKEVRRQFEEIEGIMEGKNKPDYVRCIDIATKASIQEMAIPGIIGFLAPLIFGLLFGIEALGGLLIGALVSGVLLAIFMSNAGSAWDNAKKYIEAGHFGGIGSEPHIAAVYGDTIGDPFKDTSGPTLNILIKLMLMVAVIFGPLIAEYGGIILELIK